MLASSAPPDPGTPHNGERGAHGWARERRQPRRRTRQVGGAGVNAAEVEVGLGNPTARAASRWPSSWRDDAGRGENEAPRGPGQ